MKLVSSSFSSPDLLVAVNTALPLVESLLLSGSPLPELVALVLLLAELAACGPGAKLGLLSRFFTGRNP